MLTEAELETIGAALDDYMAYADDEFASQDDLIGGSKEWKQIALTQYE